MGPAQETVHLPHQGSQQVREGRGGEGRGGEGRGGEGRGGGGGGGRGGEGEGRGRGGGGEGEGRGRERGGEGSTLAVPIQECAGGTGGTRTQVYWVWHEGELRPLQTLQVL